MQTIVGVLRGGPSREHDVSLNSGAAIISALSSHDSYVVRDIYIDREGRWHMRGVEVSPARIVRQVDVVFIGLHGEYGEDGQVQKLLERFNIPYVGTDSFGSHLAMHKLLSKVRAQESGFLTPKYYYLEKKENAAEITKEIIRNFSQPVVVKPIGYGSSFGVSVVGGYGSVLAAIEQLFDDGVPSVLIEEYIKGREVSVGIVEGLRGEELYTTPITEIILPNNSTFFSYEDKYSGETREVCPGNFSSTVRDELQKSAQVIHKALGLRHYSRSDFIVTDKGIYYLETNTLPGMTAESIMLKALAAHGVSLTDFLAHLVNRALMR